MHDATRLAARVGDGNTLPRLRALAAHGALGWSWPLVVALVRLPLSLLGYALAYTVYRLGGHPDPWAAAVAAGVFWFTLVVDLPSLALLAWRTRAEGLRLRDLIAFQARKLPLDLGLGLVVFVVLELILFDVEAALSLALGLGPPRGSAERPLWIVWWSLLVYPIVVGTVEEMVYRGYAQPRFEVLAGGARRGILLMALAFGVQHLAVPLVSAQYSLVRFVATAAAALFLGWVYLRTRRLTALVVGHALTNHPAIGIPPLLAALRAGGP